MGESHRTKYEKMNTMLSELRSVEQTLQYWKGKTTPNRERLLGVIITMLDIIATDIYDNELAGIARLEE